MKQVLLELAKYNCKLTEFEGTIYNDIITFVPCNFNRNDILTGNFHLNIKYQSKITATFNINEIDSNLYREGVCKIFYDHTLKLLRFAKIEHFLE